MKQQLMTILCALVCCSCSTFHRKSPEQTQFESLTSVVDRLVIQGGGTSNGKPIGGAVFLDTTDPKQISEWLNTIQLVTTSRTTVDKQGHTWSIRNCECSGGPTFLCLQGTNSVLVFSVHHFHHIRSPLIDSGKDTNLAASSAKRLERKIDDLRKKNPNKVADATSEPAPDADSSSHQD